MDAEIDKMAAKAIEGDEAALRWLIEEAISGSSAAEGALFSIICEKLATVAHRRRGKDPVHSTSDLVQETYLKLFRSRRKIEFRTVELFNRLTRKAMRNLLVDHARKRNAKKRGHSEHRMPLDELVQYVESKNQLDLLELNEALTQLADRKPRAHEVIELHFFLGRTVTEIHQQLQISESTVERDLRFAKAYIKMVMGNE